MKKINLRAFLVFALLLTSVVSCKKNNATKEEDDDFNPSTNPIEKTFFKWTVNGQSFSYKLASGTYSPSVDKTGVSYFPTVTTGVGINFKGKSTGTFSWGNNNETGKASIFYTPENSEKTYQHSYLSDQPNCTGLTYTTGDLKITYYGKDFIEGTFSAKLYYSPRQCKEAYETIDIIGSFKVLNTDYDK